MLLMVAVFSLTLLTAVQRIDVTICNPDGITQYLIFGAKVEIEAVYRPMHVQIVWHACETSFTPVARTRAPTFVIRLWNSRPPRTVGPASLDVMGKAFIEGHSGGTTADVYLQAIRATAEEYSADPSVVLGFVVAHELGHLLLGPGHTREGLMQAVWRQGEIDALRQRRLRFTRECAARIRLVLAVRTAANTRAMGGRRADE